MAATGWRTRVARGGPPLAVAGVLVAVAVSAVATRMSEEWGGGTFLAIYALATVAVLGSGLLAADGDDRSDGTATALIVAGLVLLLGALTALADVLGADGGAGSVAVTTLAFAAIAGAISVRYSTPVAALIAAIAVGVAAVAGVVSLDPDGLDAFRWLAAGLAAVFAAASLSVADGRMSVQLVNAAGIAILLLALSVPGEAYLGSFGDGSYGEYGEADWWEALSLFGAVNLVCFAIVRRESGPGYLGAAALFFFLMGALGPSVDASLDGWPLVLILLAAVAVAIALLRPRAA